MKRGAQRGVIQYDINQVSVLGGHGGDETNNNYWVKLSKTQEKPLANRVVSVRSLWRAPSTLRHNLDGLGQGDLRAVPVKCPLPEPDLSAALRNQTPREIAGSHQALAGRSIRDGSTR
ncbi:hypothetical protein BaRGS_00016723 [Batillaria attramentaria]|uniref:Uncharacterized protein n=1 Tax=Batillaria attramentaria TaxID=370345 RepID=A0ABD0KXX4_9CAEN